MRPEVSPVTDIPYAPGIVDGLTRPKQPKATGLKPATFVQWPSQHVAGSTFLHVARNPACGCVWAWSLDRTGLDPTMDHHVMLASTAEAALVETVRHHVTLGRFHVEHRPGRARVAASEVDDPETIDWYRPQ